MTWSDFYNWFRNIFCFVANDDIMKVNDDIVIRDEKGVYQYPEVERRHVLPSWVSNNPVTFKFFRHENML
jgi:hypothetical protein